MVCYKGKHYPKIRYLDALFNRFILRINNNKKNRIKKEVLSKMMKIIREQKRRKSALETEIKKSRKILYEFYTNADYYFRMD